MHPLLPGGTAPWGAQLRGASPLKIHENLNLSADKSLSFFPGKFTERYVSVNWFKLHAKMVNRIIKTKANVFNPNWNTLISFHNILGSKNNIYMFLVLP